MEALIKEIEKKFALEMQQIKDETALKIQKIKEKTQEEIDLCRAEIEKKAQKRLAVERKRVIGKLERHLKNQENHYKYLLICGAKEHILNKIKTLREEDLKTYQGILKRLIDQAISEAKGKILVKVNKEDKLFCKKYLQGKNLPFQILEDDSIAMGLTVYSEVEKIVVYNTFESRWKKLFPQIKKMVGEIAGE